MVTRVRQHGRRLLYGQHQARVHQSGPPLRCGAADQSISTQGASFFSRTLSCQRNFYEQPSHCLPSAWMVAWDCHFLSSRLLTHRERGSSFFNEPCGALQTAETERLLAASALVSGADSDQGRPQRTPSQRSPSYEGSRRSSMYSEGDGASTSRATSRRSMSPTDSRRVSVSSPSLAESDVVKLRKVRHE